ncbi:MAG: hypothetical protein KAI79_16705 [Bacteroidales bacterium]|nr:hypothetical protein [Bacteroidales bacterium]
MRKYILLFIVVIFITIPFVLLSQEKNSDDYWDGLHYALKYKIDKNFEKPENEKAGLDEYLYWIRLKGDDLNEVKKAWQELNLLYNANPDNEVYKKWMQKFFELNRSAEYSGTNTVNGATMQNMRKECIGYSFEYIWICKERGRKIYQAAIESGFDPTYPRERSRCLINCAIGLLESDRYGFSLYRGRERLYGYLDEEGYINDDNLDFANISCVRRGRFFVNAEGEPAKELTYAFENASEIMTECEWWGFSGERQDAEDLLVEYYKDALCKKPPHTSTMGHKFYRELAEQHKLKEVVDYNNGFYGVLYGKVEIEKEGVKKRAPGSKVVFESEDEHWETVADEKGEYRFEKVILHKHCSPFHIYAEYKGERVDDQFEGTLEQPNPNSIRLKNLLIISTDKYEWKGTLVFEGSKRFMCKYHAGGQIEENEYTEQKGNLDFAIDQISFIGMSPIAKIGKANGSGSIDITYDSNYERIDKDLYESKRVNAKENFPLTAKNLVLLIQKKITGDPKQMIKRIQELAKTDPAKATQELQKMYKVEDESTFDVELLIQIVGHWSGNYNHLYKLESKNENKNESRTVEQLIGAPIAVKVTGTMKVNKDGTATIKASYSGSENLPNGKIASFGCPPMTSLTKFELTLNKKKKN